MLNIGAGETKVIKLRLSDKGNLKVRSMVGLIPLFAVTTLEPDLLERLPNFKMRARIPAPFRGQG